MAPTSASAALEDYSIVTNAILNQLEAIERTDIPVYVGTDVPIMGFRIGSKK